jgi:starch-binding outer membrane protein, SusD/RagB family
MNRSRDMRLAGAATGLLAGLLLLAACDKPLDVNPTASIPEEEALDSPQEIAAGVRGIYDALQQDGGYSRNLIVFPDLLADNLDFTGTFDTDAEVDDGLVTAANGSLTDLWSVGYDVINRANNVLAAIPEVADLDAASAAQFRGEALFLRALAYHNLARWFGRLPLITEPEWVITPDVNVPQSTEAEIHTFVIGSLQEAIGLLPTTSAEFRLTSDAARALLARVYLDVDRWAEARDMATAVIQSGRYQLVRPYSNIFAVENSPESIFSLQYTINDDNFLAFWFFPSHLGGRRGFAPTASLRTLLTSQGGDRLNATLDIYFTAAGALRRYGKKYFRVATGDDNVIVLRIAEMYLIRAEANWRLGADPATVVLPDVNAVRQRAGVADLLVTSVPTSTALRDAILRERQLEFALEGHRFFDLRRMLGATAAAAFLGIDEFRLYFPIPQRELDANTALTQNTGY